MTTIPKSDIHLRIEELMTACGFDFRIEEDTEVFCEMLHAAGSTVVTEIVGAHEEGRNLDCIPILLDSLELQIMTAPPRNHPAKKFGAVQ
jgi:hypothetical protein